MTNPALSAARVTHRSQAYRRSHLAASALTLLAVLAPGCLVREDQAVLKHGAYLETVATQIEFPEVESTDDFELRSTVAPMVDFREAPEIWELSLQEATQVALQNAQVLRDLGGIVLNAPETTKTIFDPAIVETDPRFGVDAALSEFDALFSSGARFEKNDRALNNIFEGGGTRLFQQDLGLYDLEFSKPTPFGTELTLRHSNDYDYNNAPGNNVPNLPWTTFLEGQLRQPLLRGAGVDFGRINGRNGTVGVYNGVLIARVDTDISLAEFEQAVAELVSTVENAYWEVYFAYRDLDAKTAARDRALVTWQRIRPRFEVGQAGGGAEVEAQARAQYFALEAEVQNAMFGRQREKTSQSNIFRGSGGVHTAVRRLRLAMGIPANGERLIRPTDEPPQARIRFDWESLLAESLDRRPELRRQRWQIKRRELELLAARNYLKPQLDFVGGYRFRGLGHDLLRSDSNGTSRFDNAYRDIKSGDFQEWQLGVEFAVPIGNRKAHAAVRNAELRLSRERAILHRQEQEIVTDLSDVYAELHRAYEVAQTNYNRRLAAFEQLQALEAIYADPEDSELVRALDLVLDAQRRLADAESTYYRSLSEYAVAVKNVHREKGSLLDFNQIYLQEGPWPRKAYCDAGRLRHFQHGPSRLGQYVQSNPPIVSSGMPLTSAVPSGQPLEVVAEPPLETPPIQPERLPATDPQ